MALHARPGTSPARWGVVTVLLVVAITGTLWVPGYAPPGAGTRSAPVLLLVPVHLGAGVRRVVLDLLPAAAGQAPAPGSRAEMSHVNTVALIIVIGSFLVVTYIGFAAARWRPAEDPMHLNEWGLGGRGFGTFVSWFLLGGDIYTAYTFIAVPALVYATGAAGFYALSYTIMVFPIVFVFAPRLWSVARARGYVSPGISSGAGTVPRASGSRWRRPGSWPPCRTSRCSSSGSSRC